MARKVLILAVVAMLLPAATAMAFHPNDDCDRCHVPHESKRDQGAAGMPLWNPDQASTETVFSAYDSYYMQAAPGDPTGSTLLCLSCHDGNQHYNMMPNSNDLSTSHPQEFAYDGALQALDKELVDPDTTGSGHKGGSITTDLLEPETKNLKCTSCHDIHIQGLHSAVSVESGETLPIEYPDNYGGDDATAAELALRETPYSSDNWKIPHLQNVAGIGWVLVHNGAASDPDDWTLSYTALCKLCHIK